MPLELLPKLNFTDEQPRSYTIAQFLRDAIYRGQLQDHEPLFQSALADHLGVSPIPLREALKQLEAEGLVTFRGHRGAIVTGLDPIEAREIYDMILWLETGLMKLAFNHLTPTSLNKFESLLSHMEQISDCVAWKEMNCLFHNSLYQPADRPLTLDMLNNLRAQVDRYTRVHLEAMRDQSQQQHREILEALKNGNLDLALEALTTHLTITSQELQSLMSK